MIIVSFYMLAVQNLSVNYRGIEALTGVSLSLQAGEWVGLIGPNGAGKSTLVKAILGLTPYRGQILLNGASLKDGSGGRLPMCRSDRKSIGIIPSRPGMW